VRKRGISASNFFTFIVNKLDNIYKSLYFLLFFTFIISVFLTNIKVGQFSNNRVFRTLLSLLTYVDKRIAIPIIITTLRQRLVAANFLLDEPAGRARNFLDSVRLPPFSLIRGIIMYCSYSLG